MHRTFNAMKKTFSFALLCVAACLLGCTFQSSHVEQRVVELPANNTNSTLRAAAQIAESVVTNGFSSDLKKQFPNLTPKQLNGAYVTWNEGYFQSKKSVFLLTRIRYTGSMPEAKAVADYCESRFKSAVAARFATLDAK